MSASTESMPLTARRKLADAALDKIIQKLEIPRADFFETQKLLDLIGSSDWRLPGSQYFWITMAWGAEYAEDTLELAEHMPSPRNMWAVHRQLAIASLILRLQDRSLPVHAPFELSAMIYLGSMRKVGDPNQLVDLWGAYDWKTLRLRDHTGEILTGEIDITNPDNLDKRLEPHLDEAARRLARKYYGAGILLGR